MSDDKKPCFVIAPIGEPDSETRKRSDQVLKHIIRPAVEHCGYFATRADEIDKPGVITSQVIQRVVNDPLVIADLSETNPNVFYELAIRHAIKKPLVQIIKKGERIPFDVAGTRTIYFDHQDLDSVESAKQQIIDQTHALEGDGKDIETPISVSLDLQILKQSDKPEERSLADLVSAISDVRAGIVKMEEKINVQNNDDIRQELKALSNVFKETLFRADLYDKKLNLRKTSKNIDPYMISKISRSVSDSSNSIGILILLSFFREDAPWLYDLGLDVYRLSKQGDTQGVENGIRELQILIERLFDTPLGSELFGNSKESYTLFKELPFMLDEYKIVATKKKPPLEKANSLIKQK